HRPDAVWGSGSKLHGVGRFTLTSPNTIAYRSPSTAPNRLCDPGRRRPCSSEPISRCSSTYMSKRFLGDAGMSLKPTLSRFLSAICHCHVFQKPELPSEWFLRSEPLEECNTSSIDPAC